MEKMIIDAKNINKSNDKNMKVSKKMIKINND